MAQYQDFHNVQNYKLTPKIEDCLFDIFAASPHLWRLMTCLAVRGRESIKVLFNFMNHFKTSISDLNYSNFNDEFLLYYPLTVSLNDAILGVNHLHV
jgi:hypothetical protein